MTPGEAFKIVDAGEWARAEVLGAYEGSAVDLSDGYIHLSTAEQLAGTAARHYAGRAGLLLLTVALSRVEAPVVWEPSRGGALFPHIYGALPVAAVTARRTMSVAEDGVMTLGPADAS